MRSIKSLVLLVLLSVLSVFGQTELKELKIGDTVPDVTIPQILNYKTSTAKLSDFKGKLIILDFWASWCAPCIKAMPELQKLQEQFKDEIVILTVTSETEAKALNTFKTIPSLRDVNLPLVVADASLKKLFPHTGVPHDVVIDQQGAVKAITNFENINATTITNFLNNVDQAVNVKRDVFDFNSSKPFFMDNRGQELLHYSIVTKYYAGLKSGSGRSGATPEHGDTRIANTNTDILNMYRIALSGRITSTNILPNNRIILQVNNQTKYIKPKDSSMVKWMEENTYCLEISVPPQSSSMLYSQMKRLLDDTFNLDSRIEKKNIKCWVIKTIDSTKYASKKKDYITDLAKDKWTLYKCPMKGFIQNLDMKSDVPIVDETGFNGMVDIEIVPNFNKISSLRELLQPYGLDVMEQDRELNIITLIERNEMK